MLILNEHVYLCIQNKTFASLINIEQYCNILRYWIFDLQNKYILGCLLLLFQNEQYITSQDMNMCIIYWLRLEAQT